MRRPGLTVRLRRTLGAAACTTQPLGFAAVELSGRPAVRRYRLRGGGRVIVRHPLLDMWVLEEVFGFGEYEPPPVVAEHLRSLGRPLRVVDLGGHIGLFGLFITRRLPVASIVSFEPDPVNVELLRRCVHANELDDRWRVVQAAAGTSPARRRFASSAHLSRVADPGDESLASFQRDLAGHFRFLGPGNPMLQAETRCVEQVDVLPSLDAADLVKLDIEGAEWEILADARFAELGLQAVVLEYHPAYLTDGDPYERVSAALRRAGLTVARHHRGADAGTVWAWRPGPSAGAGRALN